MTRIVAIEPSPERGSLLRQLLRESIGAEVTLVTSTKHALTAISRHRPDLILASPLLPPQDDRDLVQHLRENRSLGHVPVLTVPPTVDLEQPEDGVLSRLRLRRRQMWWPVYDFEAVAVRIEDAIEESHYEAAMLERYGERPRVLVDLDDAAAASTLLEATPAREAALAMCARAQRWDGWQLPWLTSVKSTLGVDVRLVNLSSTGLLVESTARLTHGVSTTFELWGPYRKLSVPARIIRSDVGKVDALGVRYHAAAVFDHAIDVNMPTSLENVDPRTHLDSLVDTLIEKASLGAMPDGVRHAFESAVLSMVRAREIRLCDQPAAARDGQESVYFTIPGADNGVLQVTFDSGYRPTAEEFGVLKAAANAAATLLPALNGPRQLHSTAAAASARVSESPRRVLPAPE